MGGGVTTFMAEAHTLPDNQRGPVTHAPNPETLVHVQCSRGGPRDGRGLGHTRSSGTLRRAGSSLQEAMYPARVPFSQNSSTMFSRSPFWSPRRGGSGPGHCGCPPPCHVIAAVPPCHVPPMPPLHVPPPLSQGAFHTIHRALAVNFPFLLLGST